MQYNLRVPESKYELQNELRILRTTSSRATDYTDGDPDQEAAFYLLRHTLAPAVLVENLFMDNPSDCAFLLSKEGQQSLVDLHVDGICAYLVND